MTLRIARDDIKRDLPEGGEMIKGAEDGIVFDLGRDDMRSRVQSPEDCLVQG